ncbi:hypothetical protein GTR00_21890 [Kineococcus sp. T90]|nr:hypothetical protein [Kineococcus indalonis]
MLTTSVRLAADVTCPGGSGTVGVTLAADGIELNLNGHALTGPGVRFGTTGVRVAARDVVVRGGTVRGWSSGVSAGREVDAPDEPVPGRGTVRAARVEGNTVGVDALVGGDLTVRGSRLAGNGRGGFAYVGGRLRVETSTVEGNDVGLAAFSNADGGFVVRDSLVRGNRGAGIACDPDGDFDVNGTTVQRNGTGLAVSLCSGRVEGSRFLWNGRHLDTYLVEGDVVTLACTTFTRDGGPVPLPVQPCAPAP